MKQPSVTDALTAFAGIWENLGIQASDVEVSLPFQSWQRLGMRLVQEQHQASDSHVGKVEVAGVRYLIRSASQGRSRADP